MVQSSARNIPHLAPARGGVANDQQFQIWAASRDPAKGFANTAPKPRPGPPAACRPAAVRRRSARMKG